MAVLNLRNIQSTPCLSANIVLSDFSFKEDTLGTIKLVANNDTLNRYNVRLNINGNGNDISATGFYSTTEKTSPLNFNVSLVNVNLASIEAYTFGQLTRLKGNLKGDLKITGTAPKP